MSYITSMSSVTASTDTLPPVATKNPAVLLHLPQELLDRVDDAWHGEKLKNRSDALRYLVEWALNIRDSGTEAMDHFRPERPSR